MEELRDERLGKIVTWMQSWIRGYLSRKEFKKLQEQRLALQVCQRNLRKYLKLRTWPWYKLWQKVKPLLNVTRIEDEIAVSFAIFKPCLYYAYHKYRILRLLTWCPKFQDLFIRIYPSSICQRMKHRVLFFNLSSNHLVPTHSIFPQTWKLYWLHQS